MIYAQIWDQPDRTTLTWDPLNECIEVDRAPHRQYTAILRTSKDIHVEAKPICLAQRTITVDFSLAWHNLYSAIRSARWRVWLGMICSNKRQYIRSASRLELKLTFVDCPCGVLFPPAQMVLSQVWRSWLAFRGLCDAATVGQLELLEIYIFDCKDCYHKLNIARFFVHFHDDTAIRSITSLRVIKVSDARKPGRDRFVREVDSNKSEQLRKLLNVFPKSHTTKV